VICWEIVSHTKGDYGQMRLNCKQCLGGFAMFLFALPVWAGHIDSFAWRVDKAATIGTTQIKPGVYDIRAEEGQTTLQVYHGKALVAEVPCHWIQLPAKAASSTVELDDDKVSEVEFGGRTAAVDFKQ
jgi:hypothetical protein